MIDYAYTNESTEGKKLKTKSKTDCNLGFENCSAQQFSKISLYWV